MPHMSFATHACSESIIQFWVKKRDLSDDCDFTCTEYTSTEIYEFFVVLRQLNRRFLFQSISSQSLSTVDLQFWKSLEWLVFQVKRKLFLKTNFKRIFGSVTFPRGRKTSVFSRNFKKVLDIFGCESIISVKKYLSLFREIELLIICNVLQFRQFLFAWADRLALRCTRNN